MSETVLPLRISKPSEGEDCYPGTFSGLLDYLQGQSTVPLGEVEFVNVGSSEPPNAQRDVPWFRYTAAGEWLGVYAFQDGQWRKASTFPLRSLVLVSGASAAWNNGDGGWWVADGQNGTPDTRKLWIYENAYEAEVMDLRVRRWEKFIEELESETGTICAAPGSATAPDIATALCNALSALSTFDAAEPLPTPTGSEKFFYICYLGRYT